MEINTVMKETIYSILQEPTREKFVEYLLNGGGEQDNVDFKEKMIDHQKLSEVILGIANNGGGVIICGFYLKILIFPKSRAEENTRKMPLLRNRGAERRVYENRAYEAGKDHRYLV